MKLAIITESGNSIFEYNYQEVRARLVEELGEGAGKALDKLADELKTKTLTT